MKEVLWTGSAPEHCELCDTRIEHTFYDARTRFRVWACLCPACFEDCGVGLGTGNGQRFEKRADGTFAKTAG